LVHNKVMADCDVDAADLHLLLNPVVKERHEFRSGQTAFIDSTLCNSCGKCVSVCRFDAINNDFVVDSISCEGCAFCSFVCPEGAINMNENVSGEWVVSDTRFGPFVHARLGIAEENSGKLVALVRKEAKALAEKNNCDWVIIDGAPGIGCPVIASLSGIDCALVVTEPTISGMHDADRVVQVASHFGVKTKILVNKYDLNRDMTKKIETYCRDHQIELIGKIAFDDAFVKAMVEGKTIMEYEGGRRVKGQIAEVWKKLQENLG
jgi:MinD superfamily P-loop ATPase